ncbi:MAG: NAD-dependent epimerase/dehydratase family protein [Marmoricola sp.]
MRIVVSGGTGVIGRAAVPALVAAGHEVVLLARSAANAAAAEAMGAAVVSGDLFDPDDLAAAYDGAHAVVNLATHVPVGRAAAWPGGWREHDRLRTLGVQRVVEAADRVGVRRVVQEGVSFVYADAGEEWITEDSALEITSATEPAAVGEAHVQRFAREDRTGVVLRLGSIIGDDPMTRARLRSVVHGRPIGLGRPQCWTHVVHTDDLGSAVVAALQASSGVYNVGAEPVRQRDVVAGFAARAGARRATFLGPVLRRVVGVRVEPFGRSQRVSSARFTASTGWRPTRPVFGPDWFDAVVLEDAG